MLPGPNQIIACPHCGVIEYYETLMSGNTFGAKIYSDGKQVAPYMPEPPPLIECHQCRQIFWLKDSVELGMVSPWNPSSDDDPAWVAAPCVKSASEEALYKAIEKLEQRGASAELMQFRLLAWQKRNDPYRGNNDVPLQLSDKAQNNMEELLLQLSVDCKEGSAVGLQLGLMLAEVMRELGHFDGALDVLESTRWGDFQSIADQLANLSRQKKHRVAELQRET